jgi:hypothetical protein
LSVTAGGDADELVDVVVLLDIESPTTVVVALVALGVAFEALVPLESLHPASRPEASSNEQTIHDPLVPITWPSRARNFPTLTLRYPGAAAGQAMKPVRRRLRSAEQRLCRNPIFFFLQLLS